MFTLDSDEIIFIVLHLSHVGKPAFHMELLSVLFSDDEERLEKLVDTT